MKPSNPLDYSASHYALVCAVGDGFAVSADGQVRNREGFVKALDSQGQFSYYHRMNRRTYHISAARLAAFQRYRDALFRPGVRVHRLDGDAKNHRPDNILAGTKFELSLAIREHWRTEIQRATTPARALQIVALAFRGSRNIGDARDVLQGLTEALGTTQEVSADEDDWLT